MRFLWDALPGFLPINELCLTLFQSDALARRESPFANREPAKPLYADREILNFSTNNVDFMQWSLWFQLCIQLE